VSRALERERLVGLTQAQAAWLFDLAKADLKRRQNGSEHYHDFDAHMVSLLVEKLRAASSEAPFSPLVGAEISIPVRLQRPEGVVLAHVLLPGTALVADELDRIALDLQRWADHLRPGHPG